MHLPLSGTGETDSTGLAPTAPARKQKRPFGERGQGLVEFALVLPLFLVLILASVDFGWALKSYITLTNSAREGARLGAVGDTETAIKNRVMSTASGLGVTAADITVENAGGASGSSVSVTVTYEHNYITPLGGLLAALSGGTLPDPLPMSTSATMRLE